MRYHIVVTGSRPEKGSDGKYLPVPEQNVSFIKEVLAKVSPESVVAIYHGAAKGVDTVADDYAFENGIRVHQFPAYWQQWDDSAKKYVTNKSAGPERNRVMVNAAKDAVYGKDPKEEMVVVIGFHNKPLNESTGTKHCIDYAQQKSLTVRTVALPVQTAASEAAAALPFNF